MCYIYCQILCRKQGKFGKLLLNFRETGSFPKFFEFFQTAKGDSDRLPQPLTGH